MESAKKKDKKDKKKKFQGQKQDHIKEQKEQTLAIGAIVTEAVLKKKLKVKYFNCNKKSYYINNCTKLLKN